MNEKLKPCPFCGGEAVIKAVKKNDSFVIWCECKECIASTESYCPRTNKENEVLENIEKCKNWAVKAWNRRVPIAYDPDKVVRQLEEYREEMEQFGCSGMLSDMIEVVKGGGVE